jgi:hypothetical protein
MNMKRYCNWADCRLVDSTNLGIQQKEEGVEAAFQSHPCEVVEEAEESCNTLTSNIQSKSTFDI